jgi:hypothetical protein
MDSIFAAKDTSERQLNLALLENSTAANPSGFEGVADVQREGAVARVGLRFRNEDLDTTLVLYARLERLDRRWKVVGFDDFETYLEDVEQLQRAHLARVNAEIDRRLTSTLRLGEIRRRVRSMGWYSDYLYVTIPIENVGRDTVQSAIVLFENVDASSWTDRAVMLDEELTPGASADAQKIIDYNQFIDWHSQLRYSDYLEPRIAWAVFKRGSRADTVYRYDTWNEYRSRTK